MLPTAAKRNQRRQAAITAAVVVGVRRIWRRMRPTGSWADQYRTDVAPAATALVLAGQKATATESEAYMSAVLAELDIPAESPTRLNIPNFMGVAGDGRPVDSLLAQTVVKAGQAFNGQRNQDYFELVRTGLPIPPKLDPQRALDDAEAFLDRYVATIMADTARAAESAALVQREWVEGYVRMLNPPSCSRCTILAGRFYLWNDGFDRHPLCDCRHIPASEARSDDLTTNPNLYFDSLTAEEQDKVFTQAGAQAIRDGADIGQVVNARRGMETAQQNLRGWIPKGRMARRDVFGQQLATTTEGATKGGVFGQINRNRAAAGEPKLPFRLMPESIYEIADDRADAIRLLKTYGFII